MYVAVNISGFAWDWRRWR